MENNQLVPSLLNAKQIAEALSVSVDTIYYWVSRNEIPFLKVGRHLRFSLGAVLGFFEERTRARKKEYRDLLLDQEAPGSLKTRKELRNRSFASEKE